MGGPSSHPALDLLRPHNDLPKIDYANVTMLGVAEKVILSLTMMAPQPFHNFFFLHLPPIVPPIDYSMLKPLHAYHSTLKSVQSS